MTDSNRVFVAVVQEPGGPEDGLAGGHGARVGEAARSSHLEERRGRDRRKALRVGRRQARGQSAFFRPSRSRSRS